MTPAADVTLIPANPFQVYPVQSIRELPGGIIRITVPTEQTESIRTDAVAFAERATSAGPSDDIPAPFIRGIRGEYGSGKTHLLRYVRALLEEETQGRTISLALRAQEMEAGIWWCRSVAQALREINLHDLMTELLAVIAADVARESPLTAQLAPALDKNSRYVHRLLAEGQLNATEVERRFRAELSAYAERMSEPQHESVALGLANEQTAHTAIAWLCGETVAEEKLRTIGLARRLDPLTQGPAVLGALAALCHRLHRPFVVLLDELEHLTDMDAKEGGHAVSDWLKALVEAVGSQGGGFLLAGHPRAWETMRDDFRDRVLRAPLLTLTVWDSDRIRLLAEQHVPGWTAQWDKDSFDLIADVCHGNIRRVQTILFEIFRRGGGGPVGVRLIREAATRLERPSPRAGLLQEIAAAGETLGSRVVRVAKGVTFDLLLLWDKLQIAVQVLEVSDLTQLLKRGRDFHEQIDIVQRRSNRTVRGLLLLTGAIDDDLLNRLDRYSDITVLSGEQHDAVRGAHDAIAALLRDAEAGRSASTATADDAENTRVIVGLEKDLLENRQAVRTRVETAFAGTDTAAAELQQTSLGKAAAAQEAQDLERTNLLPYVRLRSRSYGARSEILEVLIQTPWIFAPLLFGLILCAASLSALRSPFSSFLADLWFNNVAPMLALAGTTCTLLWLLWQIGQQRRYRRFLISVIEELYFQESSLSRLTRALRILQSITVTTTAEAAMHLASGRLRRDLDFDAGSFSFEQISIPAKAVGAR